MHFDSVDLARHLTQKNLLWVIAWFGLYAIGLVTDTLNYVGPAMIAALGFWLTRTSKLSDHRIVGWLLILVSVSILYAINYAVA